MMHPSSTWGITGNQSFLLPWMKLHGASVFHQRKRRGLKSATMKKKQHINLHILSYLAIASSLGYRQNLKYLELALNLWLLYLQWNKRKLSPLMMFNFIMARHFEEIRRQHQHNRKLIKDFFFSCHFKFSIAICSN